MKIYILADMEGISGIRKMEQVKSNEPGFAEGRELMIADGNAAIAAAFEAGADEVVACDTHGGGGQFLLPQMDPRARYEIPNCSLMMPSLDESFSGLVLLGHHAKAGTLNGFLAHTMDSSQWFEFSLNGRVMGEIGIEAAYAGHYGVPVIVVTGDEACCREAQECLGEVETATVKWAAGRNRATALSPRKAHEEIGRAMKSAIHNIKRYRPFKPSTPATARLTLNREDMAEAMLGSRPYIDRVDARTLQWQVEDFTKLMIW